MGIQTIKWNYLIEKQGNYIDFSYLYKLHYVSLLWSIITPGRIGSFGKVFYLKEKIKKSLSESLISIIYDKFVDLLSLFILAIAGSLLILNYISNIFLVVIIAFILIIFSSWFFSKKERTRFLLKGFYEVLIPKKFKEKVREGFYSFYNNNLKKRYLFVPFLLSLLNWILIYTQLYLLALAMSIDINYFYFILLTSLVTIVSFLPITIIGLGVREISFITLFSIFNINSDKIVAFSLLSNFLYLLVIFIGYMFFVKKVVEQ